MPLNTDQAGPAGARSGGAGAGAHQADVEVVSEEEAFARKERRDVILLPPGPQRRRCGSHDSPQAPHLSQALSLPRFPGEPEDLPQHNDKALQVDRLYKLTESKWTEVLFITSLNQDQCCGSARSASPLLRTAQPSTGAAFVSRSACLEGTAAGSLRSVGGASRQNSRRPSPPLCPPRPGGHARCAPGWPRGSEESTDCVVNGWYLVSAEASCRFGQS